MADVRVARENMDLVYNTLAQRRADQFGMAYTWGARPSYRNGVERFMGLAVEDGPDLEEGVLELRVYWPQHLPTLLIGKTQIELEAA